MLAERLGAASSASGSNDDVSVPDLSSRHSATAGEAAAAPAPIIAAPGARYADTAV